LLGDDNVEKELGDMHTAIAYRIFPSNNNTRVLTTKCIVPEEGDRPGTTKIWNYLHTSSITENPKLVGGQSM
jgi:hypothetical protein